MKDDDIRAFPRDRFGGSYGMTLRDYFAAKVLPAILTDGGALGVLKIAEKNALDHAKLVAALCYAFADAMLKERAK